MRGINKKIGKNKCTRVISQPMVKWLNEQTEIDLQRLAHCVWTHFLIYNCDVGR